MANAPSDTVAGMQALSSMADQLQVALPVAQGLLRVNVPEGQQQPAPTPAGVDVQDTQGTGGGTIGTGSVPTPQ